jgi:predicted dithiol-disulfide oxidoreductase (DUF899 family)
VGTAELTGRRRGDWAQDRNARRVASGTRRAGKARGGQAEGNEKIKRKRLELPWVVVTKEYEFDTDDGKKTLAELFGGRSQLLAYNIMYGPDYGIGACPGCTSLADGFDGQLIHLNKRDVTFLCFSRAPIDRLAAYKKPMGWQFPYVSTYGTDFRSTSDSL